jgi:hypothetical protein
VSPNPDEDYRAKADLEPVAPVTLWLYPQLKVVKGSMQRSVLEGASQKALKPSWLRTLMLGFALVLGLRIWAQETGRIELWRITGLLVLVWLIGLLALQAFRILRTRKILRLELAPKGTFGVDV